MLSLIISDLKRRWNCLNRPTMRVLTLSLLVALCVPSLYAQRASIRAGNGLKEARGDTLRFHLDTLKVRNEISDSLDKIPRTGSVSSGRTYVSLNPFGYMNALRIIDSTDQNYMLYVPYAIQSFNGYRNFANGANDSALIQNVAGSYVFMPPSILGEWVTFTSVTVRTTYGTAVAQELFPFAMTQATADTCMYSAVLVCRTISSVRNYAIRIYKHYTSSFSGINPPLTGGTLVTSVPITNALFPNAVTSTYALVTIGYRRIQ